MTRDRRAVLAPAAGLLALAVGVGWLALLTWWWVLAREMPGVSWARRGVQALIAGIAITTAVLTLLAVLHIPCSPRALLAVLLCGALFASLRHPDQIPVPLTTWSDRWSAVLAGATFIPLIVPFARASDGQVLHLLSSTSDGGSHIQMVRAIIRDRGFFHLTSPDGLVPGTEHYPLGWASNVWFVLEGVYGPHASTSQTVHLYGFVTVVIYAVVVFTAGVITLDAAGGRTRSTALLGLGALGLALTAGFGLFLLHLNAATLVLALLALLVGVDAAKGCASPRRTTVLLGCVAIVVAQSWYLLAPVCAAVIVTAVTRVQPGRRLLLAVGAAIAPFCAYPVLIGPPAGEQVAVPGPVFLPTGTGGIGLLVTLLVGAGFLVRDGDGGPRGPRLTLAVATVVSLVEAVVLITTDSTKDTINYYGAKLLLLAMVLGAIGAAAAIGSWWSAGGRHLAGSALGGIALAGLLLGAVTTRDMTLPPTSGKIKPGIDARLLEAFMHRHPEGLPRSRDAWFADGCSRSADRMSTLWAYNLSLTWTEAREHMLWDYLRAKKDDVRMIAARVQDPSLDTIEVYVRHTCQPEAIASLSRLPKVDVIRVP